MWSIPVDFSEDIFPQGMPCDFRVISKTNSRSNCYFYRSAWTANTKSRDPAKEIEFEVSAINVVTYVIA